MHSINRSGIHHTGSVMVARRRRVCAVLATLLGVAVAHFILGAAPEAHSSPDPMSAEPQTKTVNPAAWGGNHVGKPIPDFVHGDECLFCHRNDIGSTWQKNSHGVTVRQREDAPDLKDIVKGVAALSKLEPEIEYFMGSRNRVRLMKKDGYGRFALLSSQAVLKPDRSVPRQVERWIDSDKPSWDRDRFASACAGCHTTAVDAKTKAFAAYGLDCYTCHGDVDMKHTSDTSLVWLSKKRRSDVLAVTSICAQ